MLQGWQRYKNHPDARIRRRFEREGHTLPLGYAGSIWAARRWFRRNPEMAEKMSLLLDDMYSEFGLKARLLAPLVGRFLSFTLWREERRLRRGWTYEPPTFYEFNQPSLESMATQEEG